MSVHAQNGRYRVIGVVKEGFLIVRAVYDLGDGVDEAGGEKEDKRIVSGFSGVNDEEGREGGKEG